MRAIPLIIGRSIAGALGTSPCRTSSTRNGEAGGIDPVLNRPRDTEPFGVGSDVRRRKLRVASAQSHRADAAHDGVQPATDFLRLPQLIQPPQGDHERVLHSVRSRLTLSEETKRTSEQGDPMPVQHGAERG
jgi:hypothetical protein